MVDESRSLVSSVAGLVSIIRQSGDRVCHKTVNHVNNFHFLPNTLQNWWFSTNVDAISVEFEGGSPRPRACVGPKHLPNRAGAELWGQPLLDDGQRPLNRLSALVEEPDYASLQCNAICYSSRPDHDQRVGVLPTATPQARMAPVARRRMLLCNTWSLRSSAALNGPSLPQADPATEVVRHHVARVVSHPVPDVTLVDGIVRE